MTFERRRLRVYVAGPISSDVFEGVTRGIRWGKRMVADGLAPYIPHLDAFMFMPQGSWNAFLEWDLEWSTLAEVVFRLDGESKGADLEVQMAHEHNIPVFQEADYKALLRYAKNKNLLGKRQLNGA